MKCVCRRLLFAQFWFLSLALRMLVAAGTAVAGQSTVERGAYLA